MLVMGDLLMPGVSIGIRNTEMPLCFGAAGSVLASRNTHSPRRMWLVQIFSPPMTYS